jgi:hypothetical protein
MRGAAVVIKLGVVKVKVKVNGKDLFKVSYSCYAMFNGLYLSPWRG